MKLDTTSLVGVRFNYLTAVSFSGLNKRKQGMWLCKCDCGTEKVISRNNLIMGKTKSCGCIYHRVKDLTNCRFGSLVALCVSGKQGRKTLWLCRCDCGNEVNVRSDSLVSGNTSSCGLHRRVSEDHIKIRNRVNKHKRRSRIKGVGGVFTISEVRDLLKNQKKLLRFLSSKIK